MASAYDARPVRSSSPPGPLDRADGGAGLGVRHVGWQLERVPERLAVPPGAEAAGEVLLGLDHRDPLPFERILEPVGGLARPHGDVAGPGSEVHRPHGVPLGRVCPRPARGRSSRSARGRGHGRCRGRASPRSAARARDGRDRRSPGRARPVPSRPPGGRRARGARRDRTSHVRWSATRSPTCHSGQSPMHAVGRDGRLEQVSEAVVLVTHREVAVAVLVGAGDLHVAVEVAVLRLCPGQRLAEDARPRRAGRARARGRAPRAPPRATCRCRSP